MSGVHYCFIARDSDMIVFEKMVNRALDESQLNNEAVRITSGLEAIPESSRDRYNKVSMESMASSASLECHVLFDVVFIGLSPALATAQSVRSASSIRCTKQSRPTTQTTWSSLSASRTCAQGSSTKSSALTSAESTTTTTQAFRWVLSQKLRTRLMRLRRSLSVQLQNR